MQSRLLESPDQVRDRLDVYLGRHGPATSTIYRCLLILLLGGLTALPLIHVSLTLAAPGVLRPSVERHDVRSAAGGVLIDVRTVAGEQVAAGDTIAVLDTVALTQRLRELENRLGAIGDLQSDLNRATQTAGDQERDPRFRTVEIAAEWNRMRAQLSERQLNVEMARQNLDRSIPLARSGLLAQAEADQARVRLDAERSGEVLTLTNQMAAWRSRQGVLDAEAGQIRAEIAQLRAGIANLVMISPVQGTVAEILSASTGSVIVAGERFATISPNESLMAEVFVGSPDIGSLRIGQPVRLHVDAFRFADWGALEGQVESISDDIVMLEDRPAFRVTVRVPEPRMTRIQNQAAELRKGMTVRAHFVLAERSLLQLLRDRATDRFDPRTAPMALSR